MQLPLDLSKPISVQIVSLDEYKRDGYYRVSFQGVVQGTSIDATIHCSEDSENDLSHMKLSAIDQSLLWVSLTFAMSDTDLERHVHDVQSKIDLGRQVIMSLIIEPVELKLSVDDLIPFRCLGIKSMWEL
jgi:hypothetical protein